MQKKWETYYLTELKVLAKKEFICSTEHIKMGERFNAYEKEDSYVVRVRASEIIVPKTEFDKYFLIIETKIHDVSC